MKNYIIYDPYGKILRSGTCNDNELALQAQGDERVFDTGGLLVDPSRYHFYNGKLTELLQPDKVTPHDLDEAKRVVNLVTRSAIMAFCNDDKQRNILASGDTELITKTWATINSMVAESNEAFAEMQATDKLSELLALVEIYKVRMQK